MNLEKSKSKIKSNSEFASLIKFFARYARSRVNFSHVIHIYLDSEI